MLETLVLFALIAFTVKGFDMHVDFDDEHIWDFPVWLTTERWLVWAPMGRLFGATFFYGATFCVCVGLPCNAVLDPNCSHIFRFTDCGSVMTNNHHSTSNLMIDWCPHTILIIEQSTFLLQGLHRKWTGICVCLPCLKSWPWCPCKLDLQLSEWNLALLKCVEHCYRPACWIHIQEARGVIKS